MSMGTLAWAWQAAIFSWTCSLVRPLKSRPKRMYPPNWYWLTASGALSGKRTKNSWPTFSSRDMEESCSSAVEEAASSVVDSVAGSEAAWPEMAMVTAGTLSPVWVVGS